MPRPCHGWAVNVPSVIVGPAPSEVPVGGAVLFVPILVVKRIVGVAVVPMTPPKAPSHARPPMIVPAGRRPSTPGSHRFVSFVVELIAVRRLALGASP